MVIYRSCPGIWTLHARIESKSGSNRVYIFIVRRKGIPNAAEDSPELSPGMVQIRFLSSGICIFGVSC